MTKKQLHICHSLDLGGITTFVNALVAMNEQRAIKHDVLVWQKSADGPDIIDISKETDKKARFNKVIEAYDALFVHSLKPFMIPGLLTKKNKVYLFQHGITFGTGVTSYLKRLYYFMAINVLRFKVMCSSDFAKTKLLRKVHVFDKSLIKIIPFGIELQRRHSISNTTSTVNIGFMGRLVAQKRIHKIFDAFQILPCNVNLDLKIAGTGPLQKDLETLPAGVANHNIHIGFEGHVNDIYNFLSQLDVLILPSREESYGLVVLEAFSQNVPVIVFQDSGACVEFINDNYNGFVVENTKELAELLCELRSIERRNQLKQQVSELDLKAYDISNTRKRFDEL